MDGEKQISKHCFTITVHSPLPPLICLICDSMDFKMGFCIVSCSSVISHTLLTTLWPSPQKYSEFMVCTNNDFLFPTSPPWQQHTDSWHHNSLGLCRKRLQRTCEKLTPHFADLSVELSPILTSCQ